MKSVVGFDGSEDGVGGRVWWVGWDDSRGGALVISPFFKGPNAVFLS